MRQIAPAAGVAGHCTVAVHAAMKRGGQMSRASCLQQLHGTHLMELQGAGGTDLDVAYLK